MAIFSKLFSRESTAKNVPNMLPDEEADAALIADAISSLSADTVVTKKKVPSPDFGETISTTYATQAPEVIEEVEEVEEVKGVQTVEEVEPIEVKAPEPDSSCRGDDRPLLNIWDLEDDTPFVEADDKRTPEVSAAKSEPAAPKDAPLERHQQNNTRSRDFAESDGQVVDIFAGNAARAPVARPKFPVGWIVVVDGPGLGTCFTLQAGMAQFGRGEGQAVQLDFGDMAIARTNHAAMVYDPESHQFMLGHGGKSNLVRVNGSPLISNVVLKTGDEIRIGKTTLRFTALCGEDFDWDNANTESRDNVEIA